MGLVFSFTNAKAATITLALDDSYYVGSVNPGTPSDATSEVGYINTLITVAPGTTDTVTVGNFTYEYDRYSGSPTGLDPVSISDFVTGADAPSDSWVSTADSFYMLAKYGTKDEVWFLSGIAIGTDIVVPDSIGKGGGLSHWDVFATTPPSVPEPATMLLFGSGLVSLVAFRKFRKS